MTKKLIAIWAEDSNHLIGKNGRLPWRLPKELQHFKETTLGYTLLMGRVTFEGMNRRVLPGRDTLILTQDRRFQADGVRVMHSVEEVLQWFAQQSNSLFIVGGASVYRAFADHYDRLIKTTVCGSFDGDTYFPEIDLSPFHLVSETQFEKDDHNPYAFTVGIYDRIERVENG